MNQWLEAFLIWWHGTGLLIVIGVVGFEFAKNRKSR